MNRFNFRHQTSIYIIYISKLFGTSDARWMYTYACMCVCASAYACNKWAINIIRNCNCGRWVPTIEMIMVCENSFTGDLMKIEQSIGSNFGCSSAWWANGERVRCARLWVATRDGSPQSCIHFTQLMSYTLCTHKTHTHHRPNIKWLCKSTNLSSMIIWIASWCAFHMQSSHTGHRCNATNISWGSWNESAKITLAFNYAQNPNYVWSLQKIWNISRIKIGRGIEFQHNYLVIYLWGRFSETPV